MAIRKHHGDFTWDHTDVLKYKEEGTHFKAITRQILFEGQTDLPSQLRYFEIAPGGHSTLEQHHHIHVVMVVRGQGQALVGADIINLARFDVVHIPSHTWHQFRAMTTEAFGFLCLVSTNRDKPIRPNEQQLQELNANPLVAAFIRS